MSIDKLNKNGLNALWDRIVNSFTTKKEFNSLSERVVEDTKTTTDTSLANSKAASLKINAIRGKSKQDGEPTLDVPIGIKSVGDSGWLRVTACGKNMVYNSATYEGWLKYEAGGTVTDETYNGGKIIKYTAEWSFYYPPYRLFKAGTYTISFDAKAKTAANCHVYGPDIVSKNVAIDTTFKRYSLTFTITEDVYGYIAPIIAVGNAVEELYVANIQVEEGAIATAYEPYIEKSFTIPLSEPLRSVADVEDEIVKQDGLWGITRNIKNVVNDDMTVTQHELTNDSYLVAFFSRTGYPRSYKALSTHFVQKADSALGKETSLYVFTSTKSLSPIHISIPTSIVTHIPGLRTWLLENNVEIYYPVLEPVFEPFDDIYQQMFYELESYDTITHITTYAEMEPEIEVEYATTESGVSIMNNYANIGRSALKDNVDSENALIRQTVGYTKKNLLKIIAASQELYGVTITVNEDKSLTFNGTPTEDFYTPILGIFTPEIGARYKYTVGDIEEIESTYVKAENTNGFAVYLTNVNGKTSSVWSGSEFDIVTDSEIWFLVHAVKGVIFNNTRVYPMVRSADILDETYEPYIESVSERLTALAPSVAAFKQNIAQVTTTKYYKININSSVSWMLCFTLRMYQTYVATDIQISGYNYISTGETWWAPDATIISASSNFESMYVYFGYDDIGKLWVAVPLTSWSSITILDVLNGHEQVESMKDLFTISIVDELGGTTVATKLVAKLRTSQSTAITTEGYYALDAIQNNASVQGTLAYKLNDALKRIEALENK